MPVLSYFDRDDKRDRWEIEGLRTIACLFRREHKSSPCDWYRTGPKGEPENPVEGASRSVVISERDASALVNMCHGEADEIVLLDWLATWYTVDVKVDSATISG